jgi:hypothetical protein
MALIIQSPEITRGSPVNANVPTIKIETRIHDSDTGALIADFTGNNAIQFPRDLGSLSIDHQRGLVELIVDYIIRRKAGLGD